MTGRRRWIYDGKGNATEVGLDYAPPIEDRADYHIMGDRYYDGLQATDGADISTRSKHRAYMKLKGLTTADDYTNVWKRAEMRRAEVLQGVDPSRRAEVSRALFNEVNKRRK